MPSIGSWFICVLASAVLATDYAPVSTSQNAWVSLSRDDFDGPNLDLQMWDILEANGSFILEEGFLKLRSQPSGYPTIVTKQGIIPDQADLKILIGFRYGNTTCFGTRIGAVAMGEGLPTCSNDPNQPPYYGFHRDCQRGTEANAYPSELYGSCGFDGTSVDLEAESGVYHAGELVFSDSGVEIMVDGMAVAQAPPGLPRPNVVFLGWGDACCQYTEYDIDYVEVLVRDAPIQVDNNTWGRVKAERR